MRPSTTREWNQDAKTGPEKESFSRNAAKIWNMAPNKLKEMTSQTMAKKAIKEFCKTLPMQPNQLANNLKISQLQSKQPHIWAT